MDGFKVTANGRELKTHFGIRATHHRNEAERLTAVANKLGEAKPTELAAILADDELMEKAQGPYGMPMYMSHSMQDQAKNVACGLTRKISGHRAAVDMFEFFASHIGEHEVFSLTRQDCLHLELVRGIYVPDNVIRGASGAFAFDSSFDA